MSDRNLDLAQKIIDLALSLGADSADAVVGESASLNVSCRLWQLEDTERSESRELGLRAIQRQPKLLECPAQLARVETTRVVEIALFELCLRICHHPVRQLLPSRRDCSHLLPPSAEPLDIVRGRRMPSVAWVCPR